MTIVSKGYEGDLDEKSSAVWGPNHGAAPHLISGLGGTVLSAVDRTLRVEVGEAQGWCVYDQVTAAETVTFDSASVATNPRWDAVCLHRDWQAGTSGLTTLEVVKGTTNSATAVVPSTLDASPGEVADWPFLLVPVINTGIGTPVRCDYWAAGSPLYWPRQSTEGMDLSLLGYGQTVVQFQPVGVQTKHLIRRGGSGSEVLDDITCPAWVEPTGWGPNLTDLNSANKAGVHIAGGFIEFKGSIKRTNGTVFKQGGGGQANGQYNLVEVPTRFLPVGSGGEVIAKFCGGVTGGALLNFSIGQNGNWLQVGIYGGTTDRVHLNNVRFPIDL